MRVARRRINVRSCVMNTVAPWYDSSISSSAVIASMSMWLVGSSSSSTSGSRDERAREHHATTRAARAGADDYVGGQGQPTEHFFDSLRQIPAAERVDALLQSGEPLQCRVVAVGDGVARVVIVGQYLAELRQPAGDGLVHGRGEIFRYVLFQVGNAQRVASPHGAFVGQ